MRFIDYDEMEQSNYQYIVIEIDSAHAGITRDELMKKLHAEKIMVRRYFYPGCHKMEPYASLESCPKGLLPATESVCQKVLVLPNGTGVSEDDVERVITAIGTIVTSTLYGS